MSKIKEIKQIVKISKKTISEEGFGIFLKKAKRKIDRKEFKIKEPYKVIPKKRSNELSEEEEEMLEKNLVWIFASPRSGTTWLGKELLSYNTYRINEPYIGRHLQDLTKVKKISEYHRNRKDYFFCESFKDSWEYYLRKLILNRLYNQIQDFSKPVIIKEPNGTVGCKKILECLPKSKIIVVLRDPRDVLDSELDAASEGGWGAKQRDKVIGVNERIPFLKQKLDDWKYLMEILLNSYDVHPKDLKLLIHYEELRKNTVEELQKIYDFIGIKITKNNVEKIVEKFRFENIPEELKGKGKSKRSATPGKWKENFSEEEVKFMESTLEGYLEKIGYKE